MVAKRNKTEEKRESKREEADAQSTEVSEPSQLSIEPYQAASAYYQLPFDLRSYSNVVLKLQGKQPLANAKEVVSGKDRDAVGRAIREWEKRGNIRHFVKQSPKDDSYPLLLPELEDKLRLKYHLRDVAVVDVTAVDPPKGLPGASDWMRRDDEVHRLLGKWGGRILASLLRSNDVLGVGGGRGPYYTVDSCRLPIGSSCKPKTIVSLSGAFGAQNWHAPESNQDPDLIATTLQARVQPESGAILMGCPIIAPPEKKLEAIKRALQEQNPISLALVGIGSLSRLGGHRLRRRPKEVAAVVPILDSIDSILKKVDRSDKNTPPFPHTVGDVGNWFFVLPDEFRVSADAADRLSDSDCKDLIKQVDALNRSFVTVNPEAEFPPICKHGAVLAVAGGYHKLDVIYYVLCRDPQWISHLVTDSWTAEKLADDILPGLRF